MKNNSVSREIIRLGTHGENYGNWMSNAAFYMVGGTLALTLALSIIFIKIIDIFILAMIFGVLSAMIFIFLCWITWIRRQYAFGGGGVQTVRACIRI